MTKEQEEAIEILKQDLELAKKEDVIDIDVLTGYLEIALKLIQEQQKEINRLKNHVHYKICENCRKEFISKRSDARYCKECAKTVNNKEWYRNLTEEQKERRRKQAKISMRNIRKKRREYNECKKQSEKM